MSDILIHRRGPALWPEAFPLKLLQTLKRELGSLLFDTVYQGEPSPAQGTVFQRAWLGSFADMPGALEIGQAWDTALKGGQEHDYSVCVTGGRDADGCIYILDVWRGQVEAPALGRQVLGLADRFRPRWVVMEDAGAGAMLLQQIRGRRLPMIPVRPVKDKRFRAGVVAPLVERGDVRLPVYAPWLEDFVGELLAFPAGRHDDQVDAFVHLLTRFAAHAPLPMTDWGRIQRPDGW
jgi:predicted phage terminase large subunit-like protein